LLRRSLQQGHQHRVSFVLTLSLPLSFLPLSFLSLPPTPHTPQELDAMDRQKWLSNMMNDADEELRLHKRRLEEEAILKREKEEEVKALEKVRKKLQMDQRKKAQRGANDRLILAIQRDERLKRVADDKVQLVKEWEDEWSGDNSKRRTFNTNRTIYKKRDPNDGPDTCYRCGNEGHHFKQCFSAEHISGVHTVVEGETMDDLSTKYDINVQLLQRWNMYFEATHKVRKEGSGGGGRRHDERIGFLSRGTRTRRTSRVSRDR
jgi:hypothetical protein